MQSTIQFFLLPVGRSSWRPLLATYPPLQTLCSPFPVTICRMKSLAVICCPLALHYLPLLPWRPHGTRAISVPCFPKMIPESSLLPSRPSSLDHQRSEGAGHRCRTPTKTPALSLHQTATLQNIFRDVQMIFLAMHKTSRSNTVIIISTIFWLRAREFCD